MKDSGAWAHLALIAALTSSSLLAQSYQATGSITIGGNGGWDYITADPPRHRLYVTHGTEVDVIDLQSNQQVGKITGLSRIHGVAIAADFNTGFISDGGAGEVVLFDLKTLAVKSRAKAGTNPDGIVYDSASGRVFAFNGRSGDATAVNAKSGAVDGTIALGGKPEYPVSDGKGNIYDNLEDKSEIVQIDSRNLKVKNRWPVAPCESPSGLAIDQPNRRLFAVCDNKMMAVVDADSGKVIATPTIGEGPDAARFDPGTKLAFSSNGEGTLTIIREDDKTHFSVQANVPTARGARTMALDTATHRIYLPTAQFGPMPAPTAENPHPRPKIVPGSFKVLIFSVK